MIHITECYKGNAKNGVTVWHEIKGNDATDNEIYPLRNKEVLLHCKDRIDETDEHNHYDLCIFEFEREDYDQLEYGNPLWSCFTHYVPYDIADKWAYLPGLRDSRWISANDSLPEIGEYVLCLYKWDVYDDGCYFVIAYRTGKTDDLNSYRNASTPEEKKELKDLIKYYGNNEHPDVWHTYNDPELGEESIGVIKWMPLDRLL